MQHPSIPSGCHTLWYNPFLSYWIILCFYELDINTQAMTQLPCVFCRSHGSNFQTSCLAASSIHKSCSIITRLAGGPHVYEEVSHQPKKKTTNKALQIYRTHLCSESILVLTPWARQSQKEPHLQQTHEGTASKSQLLKISFEAFLSTCNFFQSLSDTISFEGSDTRS